MSPIPTALRPPHRLPRRRSVPSTYGSTTRWSPSTPSSPTSTLTSFAARPRSPISERSGARRRCCDGLPTDAGTIVQVGSAMAYLSTSRPLRRASASRLRTRAASAGRPGGASGTVRAGGTPSSRPNQTDPAAMTLQICRTPRYRSSTMSLLRRSLPATSRLSRGVAPRGTLARRRWLDHVVGSWSCASAHARACSHVS